MQRKRKFCRLIVDENVFCLVFPLFLINKTRLRNSNSQRNNILVSYRILFEDSFIVAVFDNKTQNQS